MTLRRRDKWLYMQFTWKGGVGLEAVQEWMRTPSASRAVTCASHFGGEPTCHVSYDV